MDKVEIVDTKPPEGDNGYIEYGLHLLWSEVYGYEDIAEKAFEEAASLRAERDEAVRLLKRAGGWVNYISEHIDADEEEIKLDEEITAFLAKISND